MANNKNDRWLRHQKFVEDAVKVLRNPDLKFHVNSCGTSDVLTDDVFSRLAAADQHYMHSVRLLFQLLIAEPYRLDEKVFVDNLKLAMKLSIFRRDAERLLIDLLLYNPLDDLQK